MATNIIKGTSNKLGKAEEKGNNKTIKAAQLSMAFWAGKKLDCMLVVFSTLANL